ncbi:MAG: sulfite exporter TauE/SafE family protein [Cyanobacteria bacterium REEB65]|nr:sulfite exporter TauE/SafE family protein [Cyanobacteria bacterium REEB65]
MPRLPRCGISERQSGQVELSCKSVTVFTFSMLLFAGSIGAGFLGALSGLGGGVIIVPLLTIVFGVDIRYAIGASLVSVIATSSGAAAAYVKEGFTNLRIGMFLEIATTMGALFGAFIGGIVSPRIVAIVFGAVLLTTVYLSWNQQGDFPAPERPDPVAKRLRLAGTYPVAGEPVAYEVGNVGAGFGLMALAGAISGLLGIGSGAVKVLAMDRAMRIPFKVSTTTSNFMIGVTAAASAGIYLRRGYVDPALAMPVMLGVLLGSVVGAKILVGARVKSLRLVFNLLIGALGLEMIANGVLGRL